MPRKSPVEEGAKGSKPTQAKDQSHQSAKHIKETARLASSVETNKDPEKVRKVEFPSERLGAVSWRCEE